MRVVVCDSRSPRDGRFIEEVGYYDPSCQPAKVSLKKERILYWIKVGAQPSPTVKRLINTQK